MANDAFGKLKSSVNRGITTISVKTSSALEKTQIKTHIESLQKEVERLYSGIGESAYKMWECEEDFSKLNVAFEQVKGKKAEIEELKQKLNSIDNRDNQILGTTTEEVKIDVTKYTCQACGAQFETPVNFCRKCGQAMK